MEGSDDVSPLPLSLLPLFPLSLSFFFLVFLDVVGNTFKPVEF